MDSVELWSGDMGMEGEGFGEEDPREVLEMGAGNGMENAKIHDEGRKAKRSIKNKSRETSLEL